MAKLMIAVLTGLFVMGLSSVSFSGMLDQAAESTEKANTMAKDAKAKSDNAEQKAIEAQDASKQESGSMTDQAKETAKETVNEEIDNIGK
jgi:F0F1-type ATP synthase membrane subunit b/b'